MPKILKLNFSSPADLPVIPLTAPPVPIPELWQGLQAWIDPSFGVTSGQFAANHPAYPSKYYFSVQDAAARLKYQDPAGGVRGDALYLADFDIGTWQTMHTSGALSINGRAALQSADFARVITLPFNDADAVSIKKWSSQAYTYMLVYKADAGATGGIFGGGGVSDFSPMSSAGLRFGFESGSNTGKTLFQHSPTDRLLINRNTATAQPVIAVITCNDQNAGTVWLKSGGSTTQHAFAFTAAPEVTYTSLGWVDNTEGAARSYSAFARWNRALNAAEVGNLLTHMSIEYGPF